MNFSVMGIGFNILDVVICVVLAVAIIRGLFVGFIRSISGLIGLVGGFWAAINFHSIISQRLHYIIKDDMLCFVTGFFLIFFCVYLFFVISGYFMRAFLKAVNLSLVDRGLGGVLGALKGLVVVAIACFLLTILLPTKNRILTHSYFYPRLTLLFRTVTMMVPSDIKANFMWRWRKFLGDVHGKERTLI